MDTLLKVKDLTTEFKTPFGNAKAVNGVDFTINKGETLGIVGESGCGKSVTAMSIMGLLQEKIGKVTGGSITFEHKSLLSLSEKEMKNIRGNEIAMIFQEPMLSLNPIMKIGSQVSEVLIKHKGLTKKEALKKSVELIKSVGISRPEVIIDNYPFELSGGMLQRVMIAMGMACNPKLLIADEPTTALDVTIQAQILDLMLNLKKANNTAILLITHNLGDVAEVCDRVIVMYAGDVVEETDVYSLFDSPLHPYTIGLMNCAPKLEETRKKLDAIQGTVPSLYDMPKGCRFCTRCEIADEKCRTIRPELNELAPGHRCRCHKVSVR